MAKCSRCKGQLEPFVDHLESWRGHSLAVPGSLWLSLKAATESIPVVDLLKCDGCGMYGYSCGSCRSIDLSKSRISDGRIMVCSSCNRESMVRNPSRLFSSK